MRTDPEYLTARRPSPDWFASHAAPSGLIAAEDEDLQLPSPFLAFLLVALPLSLLPPLMAEFAGRSYGSLVIARFAPPSSERLLLILLVELLMVPLMASVIGQIGRFFQISSSYRQNFLVAILGATPLWVSSLALAVPNLSFVLAAGALGVGMAGLFTYRGIAGLIQVKDETLATLFCGLVMACGLPAWAAILGLIVVH